MKVDGKKLVACVGKGGTGKSTLARWLIWQYRQKGMSFKAFDGDGSNASLARFYPDTEIVDVDGDGLVKSWFETVVIPALLDSACQRVVLDLGAGAERLFRTWASDNQAPALLAEQGVEIVILHLMDPSLDSITPFLETLDALPDVTHQVVFNLGLAKGIASYQPTKAFDQIRVEPEFVDAFGKRAPIEMPPSLEAGQIDGANLAFENVISSDSTFTMFERLRVKKWLDALNNGLSSWV